MKRRLTLILAGVLLLALLAAGAAAAAPARTCTFTPSLVATFAAGDYGSFAEGMAADRHGNLWVSLTSWGLYDDAVNPPLTTSNIGQIWRVRPGAAPDLVGSLDLTPNGMMTGVAVDAADHVFVAVVGGGEPPTIDSGVFALDGRGKLTEVVKLLDGTFPNGLAFHGGLAYITDSATGCIWRTRVGGRLAEPKTPWLQDALLAPGDNGLGANGIAFRGDDVFVSVSEFGRIVRIPVRRNGMHGAPCLVCERPELVSADGIACDAFGGIWIAVNGDSTGATPSGALYRLSDAAGLRKIADDPGWFNYPTMPVFGTDWCTRDTLYVENGAFFSAYGDGSQPDIQALRVGVPGLPLR
jgi:sugar lactone lactonase YvrE